MTEESVTKSILEYLVTRGWKIVCFDFPQSGTGIMLHPNAVSSSKNKGGTIPDIIAVKDGTCLYFENKDRFFYPDYLKINDIKQSKNYSDGLDVLLKPYDIDDIFYGIGLPSNEHDDRSRKAADLVDVILGVNKDLSVEVLLNPKQIAF